METNWQEVREFYLRASVQGYAGGVPPTPVPELPGHQQITYEEGRLKYVDCWLTEGKSFFGRTVIHLEGRPVWVMTYSGEELSDDPRVIEFLRKALLSAYETCQFVGGRGPRHFQDPDSGFCYANVKGSPLDTFAHFSGEEQITGGRGHRAFLLACKYEGLAIY